MSCLTNHTGSRLTNDDLWVDDLGLMPGSNSAPPSELSPSLGFGELHLGASPKDAEHSVFGTGGLGLAVPCQNQQSPALQAEMSYSPLDNRVPLSNECLSPYSTSTGLSWSYVSSSEGVGFEEASKDAWDITEADMDSNFGWPNSPGASQYSHINPQTTKGMPSSNLTEVDSVRPFEPWNPSPIIHTMPMAGINAIGLNMTGSMISSFSDTDLNASTSTFKTQADTHLLTVPRSSSHRRMSDPPPFTKQRLRIPVPKQRTRANSTLTPTAYPPLQPQPPQLRKKGSDAKSPTAGVTRQTSRGKRTGPMSDAKKKAALKTRMDKSVCISCRISKVSVSLLSLQHSRHSCLIPWLVSNDRRV